MRKRARQAISLMLAALMAIGCLSGCASIVPDAVYADEEGMVTVTLADTDHGSVQFADSKGTSLRVKAGTDVELSILPDTGYKADRLLAVYEDGGEREFTEPGSILSLHAEGSCTISADFGLAEESITGGPLKLDIEAGEQAVSMSTEDYILVNADRSLTGDGDSLTMLDIVDVVHTFVNGELLPDATMDLLWGVDEDGDGFSDNFKAFISQMDDYVPLYSMSDSSDYLVGKVSQDMQDARVTDWAAVYNDYSGTVLGDVIYDDGTKLIYVPKHYQSVNDEGKVPIGSVRLQLVCTVGSVSTAPLSVGVTINNDGVKGNVAESGMGYVSYVNPYTELVLAADEETKEKFRLDLIDSVSINGTEYANPSDAWDYDEDTGVLTVYMSPAVVDSVEVNMSDGFMKKLKNFFANTTSGISARASGVNVPVGRPDDAILVFNGDVIPGSGCVVSVLMTYATGGSGVFADSVVTSVGVDQFIKDVLDHKQIDPGSASFQGGLQTWSGVIHHATYDMGGVLMQIPNDLHVMLQCAHATRVNFNFEYGADYDSSINDPRTQVSYAYMAIMGVDGEYVYIGIVVPTTHNQAGGGLFKIPYTADGIIVDPGYPQRPGGGDPTKGRVTLYKYSAHPEYTNGNSAYSFSGATYGIYDASGKHVDTLTIGPDGASDMSDDLEPGKYYAREIGSSKGYLVNNNDVSFTIYAGVDIDVDLGGNMKEDTLKDPISIIVQKMVGGRQPGESIGDIPNLGGIKFRVDYYADLYNSASAAINSGQPTASAVFATDERGYLIFRSARPVNGTIWPYQDGGDNYIPLGTVVVTEESALDGLFVRSNAGHAFTITDSGDHVRPHIDVLESWPEPENNTVDEAVGVFTNRLKEEVWHGGVTVWKADSASNESVPQGDGTLAGITYTITNKSLHPVIVNGVTYGVDEVVMTIQSKKLTDDYYSGYYATSGERVLPYGTYLIEETAGNDSYHNATWSQTFSIREDEQMQTYYRDTNWNRDAVKRGGIEVIKADWDTHRSEPQGDATLAGTMYDIYNRSIYAVYVNGAWYLPDAKIMTITTEWNDDLQAYVATTGGHTLPYGTYEVIEVWPPKGYHIAQYRQTVQIRGEGHVIHLSDDASNWNRDQVMRGGVTVIKADADWHLSSPQGDATLSGVKYEITNRSEHSVYLHSTGREYEPGEVVMTIGTAWNPTMECYIATTGASVLPYGTYDITEVEVSEGYLNANWTKQFTIRREGQMVEYTSEVMGWNENDVQRGGIIIGKVDRETGQYISLGDAHLDGSVFEIINMSERAVYVDGVTYEPGEAIMNIATELTEWNGRTVYAATTGDHVLPYGTYEVREVLSGTGYLYDSKSNAYTKTVKIREHGQMIDLTDEDGAVANQVLREDFHFQKKAGDSMDVMANVAFLITSMTTGERHVIVTDENGFWGSSTEYGRHTKNTNANDPNSPISNGSMAVAEDGSWYVADSDKLDCDAGVWFTGMAEDTAEWKLGGMDDDILYYTTPDGSAAYAVDALRAFPYDTYLVEELACDANKNYKLVRFTITLHRYTEDHDGPGYDYDLGTVDDRRIFIETLLKFDYIDKIVPNGPEVTITDTVAYGNLEPGNYTLKGELHVLADDGTDGGVVARSEVSFSSVSNIGSVEVPFTLDTTGFGGKKLVAFEYLWKGDEIYGRHDEIDDPDQTVKVLEIHTTLNGDLGHMSYSRKGTITLIDTVYYNGLEPGKQYTIEGTLVNKATGEAITDGDGNPVRTTEKFVPYKSEGTVDIAFTFSGVDLKGQTVVAFETISRNDIEYAVHADVNDEGQTVYFPEITSYAVDAADGNKDLSSLFNNTIVDALKVATVMDGYLYKMEGELHVRNAYGEDEGILLDADGNECRAEITWDGNKAGLKMLFGSIDTAALQGKSIVIYQTLYGRETEDDAWVLLAVDDDLFNADESVHVPYISTLLATVDGLHEIQVPADGIIKLTDTVTYKNLTPGHEYVMAGELHLRAVSEDGSITDGGTVVSAKTVFVPASADGTVDVVFTFNAAEYAGRTVTAYEKLYSSPVPDVPDEWEDFFDGIGDVFDTEEPKDEWLVADHTEIQDEDQSVHFPEVGTTLTSDNGQHMAQPGKDGMVSLTDVVKYKNLIPGNTYTVTGTLHIREKDGNGIITDGGTVKDGEGKDLVVSKTFVPAQADGEVTIVFVFDASYLAGKTVVAFESVSRDGIEFASHADITDEAQSVHFVKIGTTAVSEDGSHTVQMPGKGNKTVTIKDTVAYENLIPGMEYTMTGTLHIQSKDKDGAITDGGVLKDRDGKAVTSTVTFKPEKADGSVVMEFKIDTSLLKGGVTLVVFESLYYNGREVAGHQDITDKGQSITFVASSEKPKDEPKDNPKSESTEKPKDKAPSKTPDIVKTGEDSFLLAIIIGLAILSGGCFFFMKTDAGRRLADRIKEKFLKG